MGKIGLLAADLLVFDRNRLAWRLATRTMLTLMLPLLASYTLDQPLLIYVGIAGFLLAIGDSVDDGDRLQFFRLALGAILGAMAIASGTLAGASLPWALVGTLFWCGVVGLMGAYGNTFATLGLPVAWAFVELGVPASSHSLGDAAALAAAWLAGGVLIAAATWMVRIGGASAPLRERTAVCYRALADWFAASQHLTEDNEAVSPETRVRSAIAEARRVAGATRGGQQGIAWQRQLMLIELADLIFKDGAAWREAGAGRPGSAVSQLLAAALRHITQQDAIGMAAADIEKLRQQAADPLLRQVVDAMSRARQIAAGQSAGDIAHLDRRQPGTDLLAVLAPLRASLDSRSVVGRYALRFGLVTCVAVGVSWFFPPPFGFWIPLTVTVVLKPYAGATFLRMLQRVLGTMLGVLLGMALMPLLPGIALKVAAVAAAFFCLMAVLPTNYSLAILFLSLGVVPLEHLIMPDLTVDVGLMRLAATAIGAVLATLGGHLLWPDFERLELTGLLRRSLRSTARYADAALGVAETGPDHPALADARRDAGIDTTNFQMTAHRALSELGSSPLPADRILLAAATLQRLLLAVNSIAHIASDSRLAEATRKPRAVLMALATGKADASDVAAKLRRCRAQLPAEHTLAAPLDALALEIERLAAFKGA